ncbi:MAG: glycosyltransferase family 4 protein [Lachnospiraceae bacterium]|nr:glycosyltransferase family 4 protein [Lachnospiraceae bacterium]
MKRIKVLWLCDLVLPDFSQEFGIKRNPIGGWMTGMLYALKDMEKTDISLCFPIYDKKRMRNGVCAGYDYYTFLCNLEAETYDQEMIVAFERILEQSRPDIVHIWGTEYPHTAAMLHACKRKNLLSRVVINIQGLVSVYARHFLAGIPDMYKTMKYEGEKSIEEEERLFEKHGECEIESLKMISHVIGRTDWDKACVEAVDPYIQYHYCDEILRDAFYENAGRWGYGGCQKHSIFVSQAFYPIKGFHYLLEALPIVIKKYPDTHVFVAGKNIFATEKKSPYARYIEMLMEQWDLTGHISFLGKLDEKEMVERYLRANVYVLASTAENSPNSLNEAMLLGTPSIASYVGGSGNRLESHKEGYLYPYDEPALLAYYICMVFENKDGICESFSAKASAKMSRLIDPKINVEKNLAIYDKILQSGSIT